MSGQQWYNVSRYEYRLANEEENLNALRKCVGKDPNMAIGHFQLGVALFELDKINGLSFSFDLHFLFGLNLALP